MNHSNKRLKSVAHSIIAHAMSVTSFMHWDGWLYDCCVKNECDFITIDLVTGLSNIHDLDLHKNCTLAENILVGQNKFTKFIQIVKTFKKLLTYESWNFEGIKKASIVMYFKLITQHSLIDEGYPYAGITEIKTIEGKTIISEIENGESRTYIESEINKQKRWHDSYKNWENENKI